MWSLWKRTRLLIIVTVLALPLDVALPTGSSRKHENTSSGHREANEVHEKPRFLTKPQILRAQVGDTIVIPCDVQGLGVYVRLWQRDDTLLAAAQMRIFPDERIEVVDTSNLKISDLTTADAGEYTCRVATRPPMDLVHTIEILRPPSIRTIPPQGVMVVRKGETVTVACEATGNPKPTIRWSRQDKDKGLLPGGQRNVEGYSITVEQADRRQAGVYLCTASNGVGQPATAKITLDVLYPPEIEVEESWVHSGEGDEAELTCIVRAEPRPEVRWFRESRLVEQGSRVSWTDARHKHVLRIKDVRKQDFGNYSCVANNTLGTAKHNIELSGQPTRAVFKSDRLGLQRDRYDLRWQIQSFSPILEYRLLYREIKKPVPDWKVVIIPAFPDNKVIHTHSFKLEGLRAGTPYEAVVTAKNKFGWNKESEYYQFSTTGAGPEAADLGVRAASTTVSPSCIITLVISYILTRLLITR